MPYKEVFLDEIRQVSEGNSCLLMLSIPADGRCIPVVVGNHEAEAVVLAIQGIKTDRPLTHQLMCNLMHEYGLTLKEVSIDRFSEGIYYSTLTVSDGFNEKKIDSRTSDAIVLSLAMNAPIYASNTVIDETAIEPLVLDGNGDAEEVRKLSLSQLGEKLQECLENEDYEQAAEIQAQIDRLTKEQNDTEGNTSL